MDTPDLRVDRLGAVMRVTLWRPESMNAMSRAMLEALRDTFARGATDDAIRVAVVTGAGKPSRSGGE
ncbi:enoyl-CoA hydratase-related protein [Pseudorhodoferax soli]|uniref:enoyl-CoA hydratase-related protein n=1 Tax=Pseudorhodoferax soli TaxID=545864 RepID=UPI000DF25DB6